MRIAIATNSVPKSAGVKTAFLESPFFSEEVREKIEFILIWTPSWVSDMPLSEEETSRWAKNRVKSLREEILDADYYVGVEWGSGKTGDDYFLFWSSYIENERWEWHIAISAKVEIPRAIGEQMFITKKELSIIIEELTGRKDIKHENGTIGLLSHDLLPRDKAFADATSLALARFF